MTTFRGKKLEISSNFAIKTIRGKKNTYTHKEKDRNIIILIMFC